MTNLQIPYENSDLAQLVKAYDRRFLWKWLSITAAILLFEILFLFKTAASYVGVVQSLLICLGLLIIPFFACGGVEWFRDRSFAGVVLDLKFSVRLEVHNHQGAYMVRQTRRGYHSIRRGQAANYCKILLRDDEGEEHTFTVRLPGDSGSFPLRVGDRIIKYHGLPFPAIEGCKTPFCVACGHMDDDGKGECRGCGCSLIVLPPR